MKDSGEFFFITGAPLVLSIPHFYQGSEYLVKAVEGLNPNKEEHETHFDLEPVRI